MIIQHNIMSLNAHRQLSGNTNQVSKNLEKLSSGYRINRAGDDAAGLAISEKMRSQIKSLDRAKMNAQDGISLVQTAEGALTETHSMLNRLVDLATESANGTIQADDRQKIQAEVKALTGEIDRISQATNFNGINLLDGTLSGGAATNTAGAAATTTFTKAVATELAKAGLTDITASGFGAGTINVKATATTAKASSATAATFGGAGLGFKLETTAADGVLLAGTKITFAKGGTSTGAELKADGSVVVTFKDSDIADEAKASAALLALFNASGTNITGAVGHDAAKLTALKAATGSTTGTAGGAFVEATALGTTMTLAGGTAKGTTFTVSDGTKTATKSMTDAEVDALAVGGKIDLTGTGVTASLTVSDAKATTLKGKTTDTKVGTATATAATAGKSEIKFSENLAVGATLSFGSGADKVVFEMIKAAGDTVKAGNVGIVVGADVAETLTNIAGGAIGTNFTLAASASVAGGTNDTLTVTNANATDATPVPTVAVDGMGLTLQIGETADAYNKVTVSVANMGSTGLSINALDLGTQEGAAAALKTIKSAVETVSVARGTLGALQNRLEHTINNLGVTSENMTAAESRIRDVDMAKEMMDFTKNNVLSQAAQAMLAQANQQPQQVLQLLR